MDRFELTELRAAWKAAKAHLNDVDAARPDGTPRAAWRMEHPSGLVTEWPARDASNRRVILALNFDTAPALRVITAGNRPKIIGHIDLKAADAQAQLDAYTPVDTPMGAPELVAALDRLGRAWGLDRPLHNSELARALRLGGRDPGRSVQDWVTGKTAITGPVQVAILMMLAGAMPPDPLDTIIRPRRA